MNKIIISGRLTRDPEQKVSQQQNGELKITNFSIAVNKRRKSANEQQTANFFNCTAFGKTADVVATHCKQGTKLIVSGTMEQDNYTNKNGDKVYSWNLVVDEIEFAESKSSQQGGDNATQAPGQMQQAFNQVSSQVATPQAQPQQFYQQPAAPAPAPAQDGFLNIPSGFDAGFGGNGFFG